MARRRSAAANTKAPADEATNEELEQPKVEPKPKPAPAPKKEGLSISARQFCKARGLRWERSAGWIHFAHAKYKQNHRLTVPEWQEIWDAWWQQPAGQSVEREV